MLLSQSWPGATLAPRVARAANGKVLENTRRGFFTKQPTRGVLLGNAVGGRSSSRGVPVPPVSFGTRTSLQSSFCPPRRVAARTNDPDRDPWVEKEEPQEGSILFDTTDEKVITRKTNVQLEDSNRDTQSTIENDLTTLESVLGFHMNENAARLIATDFVALGIDTPKKVRSMIVNKSFRLLLIQLLAVLVNGALAYAMFTLFANADIVTSNMFETPASLVTTNFLQQSVKFLSFFVGGAFAIEAAAHFTIFGVFLINTFLFGFSDLRGFSDAVCHLSLLSKQTDTPTELESFFANELESLVSVPGVSSAKRAVVSLAASKKLGNLRVAIDDALKKTETSGISNIERLAGIMELSVAEAELGFDPNEYNISEKDALVVASVFAEYDTNFDGFLTKIELTKMIRHLLDNTHIEFLFDLEWEPDSESDWNNAFNGIDTNADGQVSLEEFIAWWRAVLTTDDRVTFPVNKTIDVDITEDGLDVLGSDAVDSTQMDASHDDGDDPINSSDARTIATQSAFTGED